ncbi:hypothetical protein BGZ47_001032 [Haplosporangium gracile]|nr:hypothetical protein BGZ47_001032 [Haplosporangium gracile]
MNTLATKTKKLTSESSQPQDSMKSSHKFIPKIKSSKTTKVHKSTKMTTAVHAQTDKKGKLEQKAKSKKDATKAKAAKKEAGAATSKSKSKESSSASAPASASTSNPAKKKKKKNSTKGAAGTKESEGSKACKRTVSEVEDSDKEDEYEDEAEGRLGYHRLTKIRRIQKGKAEEVNARPAPKRKESVHNPAIWKVICGGSIASSDSSTTTTMITMDKDDKTMDETAIKAAIIDSVTSATITSVMKVAPATDTPPSGVGLRVIEEVRDAVDQLSVHENNLWDRTGDFRATDLSKDQGSAIATATTIIPRHKTLDILNNDALEKDWAAARGKLD